MKFIRIWTRGNCLGSAPIENEAELDHFLRSCPEKDLGRASRETNIENAKAALAEQVGAMIAIGPSESRPHVIIVRIE